MPTLRLTQTSVGEASFRVEVALEGEGLPRQIAITDLDFHFEPRDRERLRWYLEDYLEHVADPAPKIAASVEERIAEMGIALFKGVFQANDDARDLWATLRASLNNTRVEVVTGVREATALPWELLRDPKTDVPLVLRAEAFVRAAHQVAQRPHLPQPDTGSIRILLVICRPGGIDDVPFRSVASRLIKGLSETAREAFQLDVLRPPTFAQMSKVLRAAKTAGEPYHIVHFDGHGIYQEGKEAAAPTRRKQAHGSLMLSGPRAGAHGYLLFENAGVKENTQLVDGPAFGKLLVETDVPVLVLNACRSAHAEALAAPATEPNANGSYSSTPEKTPGQDVHTKVRAFGSLAQEVVDAGVPGVVAMRYNVYVVTAAQFVADLYESLAGGQALGTAVTLGRKQLEAQPLREIAYEPRPLQDWMVPIVYEAAPVTLFPKPAKKAPLKITVSADATASSSDALDPELEKRPDAGFFGRDETLLALDRAFDTQKIVLLHAYAGSGKTSTAAEFARWYYLTGGINGPVLFTSFEQYKPLAQVLNETIGRVFDGMLEQSGIHWLTLTDKKRRDVALQVMQQIPVLWIWDNVEPIAGFPEGAQSAWNDSEQIALADFLRAAKQTKAKLLLTSRRDERNWVGDLPARIAIPPMPMQERIQLARALAEKNGRQLSDVDDWMPLLRFTGGNPLTINVLVGQALRDDLRTKEQIESFVGSLQAGEAVFADEASEGRDKSLGASLSYGFAHAFSEAERRQLALLHLFQGSVDVEVLRLMGHPEAGWCLPEVRGMTREAGINLLDRAAEIGLLSGRGGFYIIHPVLPWFFRSMFDQYHSSASKEESSSNATRAFVESTGELASYYYSQFQSGNREVIEALSIQEANILHACRLARKHGWRSAVIFTMQSLFVLYQYTGRTVEWAVLFNDIKKDFLDPNTGDALPGEELLAAAVIEYRVGELRAARRFDEAERVQRSQVEWARKLAMPAMEKPESDLTKEEQRNIRTLANLIERLGHILRERGNTDCVGLYIEAMSLYHSVGAYTPEAIVALNLARAFTGTQLPEIQDLAEAERWCKLSLKLRIKEDRLGAAKCWTQLGMIAYRRLEDAKSAKESDQIQWAHLKSSAKAYEKALKLLPEGAQDDLAVINLMLGNIYGLYVGDVRRAMTHWSESINHDEKQGDRYGAGKTRYNIAFCLAGTDRKSDALEYGYAALRDFEACRTSDWIQKTKKLITRIKRDLRANQ